VQGRVVQGEATCVANQRKDFQHKPSTRLVQNFGMIAVENLNGNGLSAGMLAKAVHDVGWSSFLNSMITFLEPFPIGLAITLFSAAVLRKKAQSQPGQSSLPAS